MKNVILLVGVILLAVSCGNAPQEASGTQGSTEQNATKAGGEAVLEISGNDLMQYDKSELKVKAGQKVTLTLTHAGEMAKSAMGHNWVLLKQGTDMATFAAEAISAADNDYIPKDTDAVIANTKMLGGGESVTITFDAPAAGTYDFICSFPGHYALMKGKFIVE
jgi:azurin